MLSISSTGEPHETGPDRGLPGAGSNLRQKQPSRLFIVYAMRLLIVSCLKQSPARAALMAIEREGQSHHSRIGNP